MRRAQSVRHHGRPSFLLGTDDLGILRENEESAEDTLRRQLLEKDRENDKLQDQILQLQGQLVQRPPLEAVQELKKEYTNLEILLQGTQRENERCMAELERGKQREKALERELERLAGANWQVNLDISPVSVLGTRQGFMSPTHTRSMSIPRSPANDSNAADPRATKAYVEQVRLLVLGMEQRMQDREEKLLKSIEKADAESSKAEALRKQVLAT